MKLSWQDSLLFISSDIIVPHDPSYEWTTLKLDISVRSSGDSDLTQEPDLPDDYKYIPVRRALSDDELRQMEKAVRQSVPMPPVDYPVSCVSCGDPAKTASLKLEIVVDAVKLSKNGPERIIGKISTKAASRIIVGQKHGDSFQLEWLSPLLQPNRQVLLFRDVNADGVAEIWSLSVWWAGSQEALALSIFDLNGKELTRDAGDCGVAAGASGPRHETPLPAACPITGYPSIDHFLDESGNGKIVLQAAQEYNGDQHPPKVYKLVGGKYIRVKLPSH